MCFFSSSSRPLVQRSADSSGRSLSEEISGLAENSLNSPYNWSRGEMRGEGEATEEVSERGVNAEGCLRVKGFWLEIMARKSQFEAAHSNPLAVKPPTSCQISEPLLRKTWGAAINKKRKKFNLLPMLTLCTWIWSGSARPALLTVRSEECTPSRLSNYYVWMYERGDLCRPSSGRDFVSDTVQ